ncbi:MAG: ABC transporter permease [Candidatus Faecisoma sp.]|nr:ABC transporter permease [Candidatus Faecisoma sp.]
MIVFKTILKILNKLKGMLILYTFMLVMITFINQTSNNETSFLESKPSIAIVNEDDSLITNDFIDYMDKHCIIKNLAPKNIDDALFYRSINMVVYIPKDFGENLLSNNVTLEYKASGDEASSYTKMLIEKYIKTVLIYKDYYNDEELINHVNNLLKLDANVEVKTKLETSKLERMTRYFNFLNYALLAGSVYCISMILASIKEEKVKKRTIISSFDYKKYDRIVLGTLSIVIFGIWLLYMLLSIILFKNTIFTSNGLAYILNSFVFTIASLCIGYLIGNITQNKNAIAGIINVVALGSSFLCGCFVPVEYMPDYALKIAHIFPTYYYVSNNEIIKTIEAFNPTLIKSLLKNGFVIVLFSLLFILLTNYISKKKQIIN